MSTASKSTLERLKEQRAKIEARIQATENRNKHTQRKQDTRRKILIGSFYLDKAIKENKLEDIKKLMDDYLTRDSDRKLFELSLKTLPKQK
jgi:large subunit ribosomal protein L7/L12